MPGASWFSGSSAKKPATAPPGPVLSKSTATPPPSQSFAPTPTATAAVPNHSAPASTVAPSYAAAPSGLGSPSGYPTTYASTNAPPAGYAPTTPQGGYDTGRYGNPPAGYAPSASTYSGAQGGTQRGFYAENASPPPAASGYSSGSASPAAWNSAPADVRTAQASPPPASAWGPPASSPVASYGGQAPGSANPYRAPSGAEVPAAGGGWASPANNVSPYAIPASAVSPAGGYMPGGTSRYPSTTPNSGGYAQPAPSAGGSNYSVGGAYGGDTSFR